MLHDASYMPWRLGEKATRGLEQLAESGAPNDLLAEATDLALAKTNSDGILPPWASTSVTLTATSDSELYLTTAAMLVNTNDAFTGLSGYGLKGLAVGQTRTQLVNIYEAGTEANSETAATVPGPASNGEGYNSAREARDTIAAHGGVVTASDGLADSALDESHRFDQGAQKFTITRLQ